MCYFIAQCIVKTGNKQQPLLWKVTAEVGDMEHLSLDNGTTDRIDNYQKTAQAKF